MSKELIISVADGQIEIAQCEDKRLVQYGREEARSGYDVGDIYLGVVRKIMPGLNAAFVNVGHEKDAFVHYVDLGTSFNSLDRLVSSYTPGHRGLKVDSMKLEADLPRKGKITDCLSPGKKIMVQISKEAISTKGPRLTCDISIAGRDVVLLPFSNKIMVSQKIRSNEKKKRLRAIAAEVLPRNYGVIIRTAAAEAAEEDIKKDILTSIEKWIAACRNIRRSEAPSLLMEEMSRANTIIRDNLDDTFSLIAVDDESLYGEIKSYMHIVSPEQEKILKLYRGNVPIFDNYDITRQIKSMFAKYVSLKHGAYLIIESTEAMNVIDVNSGNRTKAEDNQEQTATDVNLAAAAEIARQLRLRDMGGIVIVDFIDMHQARNKQLLLDEMRKLMASDKAKHTILPLTKFGLMQITRQRIRPLAAVNVQDTCPTCGGTGKVEPTVLLESTMENQISLLTQERGYKYIRLHVSPYVAAYLRRGPISLRMKWMVRYKVRLAVCPDKSFGMIEVRYEDRNRRDILHK